LETFFEYTEQILIKSALLILLIAGLVKLIWVELSPLIKDIKDLFK
jgi:hypothetical protein